MTTSFKRGRSKDCRRAYPHRLKIIFHTYNQSIEDFCNEYFNDNWGIRFYNEECCPMSTKRQTYYILCFSNKEDAVLFKLSFTAEALTDDEIRWDNALER